MMTLLKRATWQGLAGVTLAFLLGVQAMAEVPVYEMPYTINGRRDARVPELSMRVPEGLLCAMPLRWTSRQIHQSFPSNQLILDETRVYTSSATVYALDRQTGEVIWRFMPPEEYRHADSGDGITALKKEDGVLYFTGFQRGVFALDPATGEQIWATPINGAADEYIESDAKRLYVGTSGTIYAIDKKDGKIVWTFEREKPTLYFHQLRLAEGIVLVTGTRVMYALDAQTGKTLWTYEPDIETEFEDEYKFSNFTRPQVNGNHIIALERTMGSNIMNRSGDLLFINIKTGELEWRIKGASVVMGGAYLTNTDDGRIVSSNRGRLGLLNVAERRMEWALQLGSGARPRPAYLYKDLIFAGTDYKYIYALDLNTGKEVFRHEFDRYIHSVRSIAIDEATGELYFLSSDGRMHSHQIECPQLEGRWD